jgi:hypothetical protein
MVLATAVGALGLALLSSATAGWTATYYVKEPVYVVATPGGQWGAWRRLPGRSAAADVNGDSS